MTRMLNGGTSSSAMRLNGQVMPQAMLSTISMSRAVRSAASCWEGFGKVLGLFLL